MFPSDYRFASIHSCHFWIAYEPWAIKSSFGCCNPLPLNRLHAPAITRHKLALRFHVHRLGLAAALTGGFHFHRVGLGAVHGHGAFAAGGRVGAGEFEFGGVAAALYLFLLAVALL